MSASGPAPEVPSAPPRFLKFVALIQIPLILLAIGVYAYVFMTIRPLLEQRDALAREIESLEKSVKTLRGESERYRTALRQAPAAVEPPITALVKPSADRRATGDKYGDRPIYLFSVWLEAAPDVMARIAAVQWEFNHPTFKDPKMRSTNRADGFRVSYTGWGCLTSVIVTLTLTEPRGEPPRFDFDMCAAIPG